MSAALDDTDRAIINRLQGGFPLAPAPFTIVAEDLSLSEDALIARIAALTESGVLSRFGPLFDAKAMGGDVCLCALAAPEERYDAVMAQVNAHAEVAHNYAREHALNMWFVVSAEKPERIGEVCQAISAETGLEVFPFPKTREFFLSLQLRV
jgi:DNA-binding Lrp family transcriptional regulator